MVLKMTERKPINRTTEGVSATRDEADAIGRR